MDQFFYYHLDFGQQTITYARVFLAMQGAIDGVLQ